MTHTATSEFEDPEYESDRDYNRDYAHDYDHDHDHDQLESQNLWYQGNFALLWYFVGVLGI